MNKFAVIIPYFGIFKPSIVLYLESCNRNPDVDFHIFTDCETPENIKLNRNIKWISSSLSDVELLIQKKIGFDIRLEKAYKLCDIKPFYGLIFADYLNNYEYWGFGDTDVIYGNLTSFLYRINYNAWDKINWMGHLCFVRNQSWCNNAVLSDVEGTISAKEVLCSIQNLGFDERDYNKKCISAGMKIYTQKWAADIDIYYWRMRCVDLKTFHILLKTKDLKYAPKNYAKQIFVLLNGTVYRIFIKHGQVHFEEFSYIHFRREVPIYLDNIHQSSFIISRDGFHNLPYSKSELTNINCALKLINKYNCQENSLQELYSFLHYMKRSYNKIKDNL